MKGFSLVEVIIAIFVITIGIVGAVNLISYTISGVAISKSQIIAANLAQEGIEVVRNIRDSNWLEDVAWDDGLGVGEWRVQYNSINLLSLGGNPVLKIDGNGVYRYDAGSDTHFSREIIIDDLSSDYKIQVISKVTWNERGRSPEVIAETILYNWK